jgi:hypothetical protein
MAEISIRARRRLEPGLAEHIGDIIGGRLDPFRAGLAPFSRVGGQETDVCLHPCLCRRQKGAGGSCRGQIVGDRRSPGRQQSGQTESRQADLLQQSPLPVPSIGA